MSLRDQILAAADMKPQPVTVAEWGCTLYVKTMDGHARTAWSEDAFDDEGKVKGNFATTLVIHTLTDEAGERIFTMADSDALQAKHGGIVLNLFARAKRANKIGTDELDAAEKN